MPWRSRARRKLGFLANRPVGVPTCPALLRPAAAPCAVAPRSARGLSGFWIRQVGLHRNSFVRASEEAFRTVVFGCLEGKGDVCLLREPTRRRPVLPRPAPPRPAAPPPRRPPHRVDPPVVCQGFGFDLRKKTSEPMVSRQLNPTLSNPKPGHTTGGTWRGSAPRGVRAERGGAGRDANGSVRPGDNRPCCFPGPPGHRRQLS